MTTDRRMQESSGMAGEGMDDAVSGIRESGYSPLIPAWGWAAPDAIQLRRWLELLSKPIAADTDAGSPPKSYRDVLDDLRKATGLEIMPVKRFDPAADKKMVVAETRAIVKSALAEFFPDGFVFGPIEVEIKTHQDGDEYLDILVVFEGDRETFTFHRRMDFSTAIRPGLAELGYPGFPSMWFVEKSAWVKHYQSKLNGPAGTD